MLTVTPSMADNTVRAQKILQKSSDPKIQDITNLDNLQKLMLMVNNMNHGVGSGSPSEMFYKRRIWSGLPTLHRYVLNIQCRKNIRKNLQAARTTRNARD